VDDAAVRRDAVPFALCLLVGAWGGAGQRPLTQPRFVDGQAHCFDQVGLGLGEFQIPILIDQLIAKFRSPRVERLFGGVEGVDPVGAHEKERIRFGGLADTLPTREVFARRAEPSRQRIAWPGRPDEIRGGDFDVLGLQNDSIAGALDVHRPALGLIGPVIGDHGIGRLARLGIAAGRGNVCFSGGNQSGEATGFGAQLLELGVAEFLLLERRFRGLQLHQLLA
jgi:hypothetical protein